MKHRSLFLLVTSALFLQGCSSGPSTAEKIATLSIHADNRVAYTLIREDDPIRTRAWSSDASILALELPTRLINTKEIATVNTFVTRDATFPLRLVVLLRNGERIEGAYRGWHRDVAWVACTPSKACTRLDAGAYREAAGKRVPALQVLDDADLTKYSRETALWNEDHSKTLERMRFGSDAAFPAAGRATMRFSESFAAPDLNAEFASFVHWQKDVAKCKQQAHTRYVRGAEEQKARHSSAANVPKDERTRRREQWTADDFVNRSCAGKDAHPWDQ